MRILVDADACPVIPIILKVAKEYAVEVVLFTDTNHMLSNEKCKVIIVDKGKDSVDMAIVNKTTFDDIIITQDYGLAAMVLSKRAKAMNQNGMCFTEENIDGLLYQRYIGQKIRNAGGRTQHMKKRIKENDLYFETSFKKLIKNTYER